MTASSDALSEVLRTVRLRACIYFVKDMAPPWGLDVPATPVGPLHMVLDGECLVRHSGKEIALRTGDAILLPYGVRHEMIDSPDTVPEPGPEVMERLMNGAATGPVDGSTRMLCGHFEWDNAFDHPLFRELPDAIIVRDVLKTHGADQFRAVVEMITSEANGEFPGSSAVADRMGEVLFVCILRAWMLQQEPAPGVLATMRDVRLSRALRHMHENAGDDIDLGALAGIAGMSRTSFAVKFRAAMGTPPAAYLKEWRMLMARKLLLESNLAMGEISERSGYGSEAALVRAFKRRFGITPARLRRNGSDAEPA